MMALVANGIRRANYVVVSVDLPPPIDKHVCGFVDVDVRFILFLFCLAKEKVKTRRVSHARGTTSYSNEVNSYFFWFFSFFTIIIWYCLCLMQGKCKL